MKRKLKNRVVAAAALLALLPALPSKAAPSGGGGGSAPASTQQIDPQQSFKEGIEALQAGDFKKAERKFGEVLSVAPKNPEANYYMGLAKAKAGKDKQAVKYFDRAIKERENFIEAREQKALANIRLGDGAAAEAELAAIRAILGACAPDTCDAAFMERAEKAAVKIEAALAPAAPLATEGDPAPQGGSEGGGAADDDAQASAASSEKFVALFTAAGDAGATRYRDAVRLINESRYEAAIVDLSAAQAISGPHPDILNYLGFAHRKLGRLEAARDYYRQALTINPDHLGATEYLGELYLETGDLKKAKAQLARLDRLCAFGCAEREDLARLIAVKDSERAAAK